MLAYAVRRPMGPGVLLALGLLCVPLLSEAEDTLAVVVSKDKFQPDVIRVRRGETLRLNVTSADEEHCFAVDELRIEKRVLPAKPTVVDLTPDRAGHFRVYCCLESEGPRGELIVSE